MGNGNKRPDSAHPPSSNPPHVAVSFWKPAFFVDAPHHPNAAQDHHEAPGEDSAAERASAPAAASAGGAAGERGGGGKGEGGCEGEGHEAVEDDSGRLRAFWRHILTTEPKGKSWVCARSESRIVPQCVLRKSAPETIFTWTCGHILASNF